MKHFQVMAAGKPIFFFEVAEEFADDELTNRNSELVGNLAEVLEVATHGPNFVPQLISKIPLVLLDKDPDHGQEGLRAWVSPKLNR
jgi:hypothetical protein